MIDEMKLIEELGKKLYAMQIVPMREVINIINEQPKLENTETFKHFKLYNDNTLKSMTKDELIDYIHILYDNWKTTDCIYNNAIDYSKKLEKDREWIPCSERLPEAMERVLVYAEYTGEKSKNPNINNDVIATNWIDNHGYWVCMGVGYVVKAWMPLPEPYRGDEE